MKTVLALAAIVALMAGPGLAPGAMAKDSPGKPVKAEKAEKADKGAKAAKPAKADYDPNWGKSEDHRQDADHGHKGKGKAKGRD